MLRRIGIYCVVLALTGAISARSEDAPLLSKLLRLQESASRHPDRGLTAADVAEVLPQMVLYDQQGQPKSVRYRVLSSLLLDELVRLSERIAELEAAAPPPDGARRGPLVRITVAHE